MFDNIKLAFGIAKQKRIDIKIEKMREKMSRLGEDMIQSALEGLKVDLAEINDKEIIEEYEDCDELLEISKESLSDFTIAKLISIKYDFVKKLEEEIKRRGLKIELDLSEKYKNEIFK